MNLPRGRLVRSRVVEDPAAALRAALDRELTGYVLLEPQDTLLLDAEDVGVVAVEDGVPVAAAHAGTGRGGPPALADLALPGPYSAELHALPREEVGSVREDGDLRVPPGMPAERLAGDADLADRTRDAAGSRGRRAEGEDRRTGDRDRSGDGPVGGGSVPDDAGTAGDYDGVAADDDDPPEAAVAAFLDDETKIDAIRDQAREQARQRAEEWDLDDHLME